MRRYRLLSGPCRSAGFFSAFCAPGLPKVPPGTPGLCPLLSPGLSENWPGSAKGSRLCPVPLGGVVEVSFAEGV